METTKIFENNNFCCHLLINFFVDPLGVGRLSCASKCFACQVVDSNYYKAWLRSNEKGVFRDAGVASSEHYFVAQLFRRFLRRVQCRFGESAVVAGGLAVNYFLGTPAFANDIDIFVTRTRDTVDIVNMYVDSVLAPLRVTASPDLRNLSFISAKYEDGRALNDKLTAVRERIRADIEAFILLLNLPDTDNASNVKLATLRATADNLPPFLASAGHKVRQSFRFSPIDSTFVRPLNIVVVYVEKCYDATMLAKTICTSFDLQHCAISFTTSDNFSFQYDCFDRSQECAVRRQLELRPTSFLGPGLEKPIMIQLKRVWKYIQQGYTWEGHESESA